MECPSVPVSTPLSEQPALRHTQRVWGLLGIGARHLHLLTPHTCAPSLGWALRDGDWGGTRKEQTCEIYAQGNLKGREATTPKRKL